MVFTIKKEKLFDLSIIGGCGHVGLPLGIVLANKNYKVNLIDFNTEYIIKINNGIMPFIEKGSTKILKKIIKKKLINCSTDLSLIKKSKNVIFSLGTPVNKKGKPNLKNFFKIIKKTKKYIDDSQNIIIRSSVFPGTLKKIKKILNTEKINYCPERILQGESIYELNKLPQIVSGFDKNSIKEVAKIFKKISPKIIYTTVEEAELIKLYTNAWRYIKFATVNEFYMMAKKLNLDFAKIRKTMMIDYDRASDLPTAGFASGPCLYKDTQQLSSFYNKKFKIGNSAIKINQNMPNFILNYLEKNYNLKKIKIGILGMAFKANIDDLRDSLSLKLEYLMKKKGLKVYCSDIYFKKKYPISSQKLIELSDIIIIGVKHKQYNNLNFKNKKVIDMWNNN